MFRLRPPSAALPVCLGIGLMCTAGLNGQNPPLALTPIVEISTPTVPGKTYRLERSTNLSSWTQDADIHFGDGSLLAEFVTPVSATQFFRVREETAPAIGPAPWTLQARKLGLNFQGQITGVSFTSATQGATRRSGAAADEPFTYTLQRSSAEVLTATLDYGLGRSELLRLIFSEAQCGTFEVSQMPALASIVLVTGSFADIPSLSPAPPAVPVSINSLDLIFSDGGTAESIEIGAGISGTQTEGANSQSITFTYTAVDADDATFVVQFGGGRHDSYNLKFTAGRAGTFQRTQTRPGLPTDQDTGVFSVSP